MDLGIRDRRAIVCGASRGLGRACAEALAAEGVHLVLTSREPGPLGETAAAIRDSYGVDVATAAGDITTEAGRRAALDACPEPDILVNNAGGPPVGDWKAFGEAEWSGAANNNMIAPILLIRDVIDGMAERGFGRIVNITSIVVKQPNAMLALSVGARLGLTGFVKSVAPAYIRHNVTLNNLLPETFETHRLKSNIERIAERGGRSFEAERDAMLKASPARRFGRLEEFGAACAFYCSAHAGYMTGQNVMLDGGRYPATF